MPNTPYIYASDFIETLKKKHASGTYKEMVKFSISILFGFLKLMVTIVYFCICNIKCHAGYIRGSMRKWEYIRGDNAEGFGHLCNNSFKCARE